MFDPYDIKCGVGIRVCVSEWYLQAVQLLANQLRRSPECRTKKLPRLSGLLAVPLVLDERCFLVGSYNSGCSSNPSKFSLRHLTTSWFRYNLNERRCEPPLSGILFECNVAFVLQAIIKYAKAAGADVGIDLIGGEQAQATTPTIRAICFLEPWKRERRPPRLPTVRRIEDAGSSMLCKLLPFYSSADLWFRDGTLTWRLSEQESEGFVAAYHDIWYDSMEAAYHDFMYERGNIPSDAAEVVRWPPPLRPTSGMEDH